MSEAQNRQMNLILPTSAMQKLIRLCYIIPLILILGCGSDKKKKTTQEETATQQTKPSQLAEASENNTETILCFGDSITAGYGLEDSNDAFPAVLQEKIDSLNLKYIVVNSGLSGETTAGGKSRIDWVLNQDIDIFLLELGANDGLRGVPLSETRSNLQAIIRTVKEKSPKTKVILAGMQLPPNMGQKYTTEFRELFSELAEANNLAFIPFILKDVGGIAELNQSDGIHPTVDGHKIVAHTVWEVLKPMLE
ncbi:multifunctional acyl-CoA thioesterase I/lysophospholipase, putative [Psychroflexus torquis ATCC 700755]|uniref:Multifunctional acyl-CoA thioesterase I/lysophospholipase, putative n=1 Tax=Psychroflexus torquis (strain ATCC 700755 / CIP 106069 / ACAM 623) TaxID=313595 RepID=K4IKI0_PSYTT|nr:arylesterase [Psychroflexus torquis]AFU70318.1 multifunctional acyl-CoA thioesterase I/lysophospholipase, putative [Psychroflexus torquis ATCC 700755]